MDTVSKITKVVLSAAVLLMAISAFIFVLKYDSDSAHGVGIFKERSLRFHNVYTQSANGKTMYRWYYNQKTRKWMKQAFK